MTQIDVLSAERAKVAAQVGALAEEWGAIVAAAQDVAMDDEHDPDGSTVGFERARVGALLDQARRRLAALDQALGRAHAGRYGRCEECGVPIPPERLAALPETVRCVACADPTDPRRSGIWA
ncbi:MAG: DnaK suppressor protein [Acidimicrobiaceae bacterium]|jgi:RNA polymerase-binding transcription factor DksA|nr:DnaK suppressor protein [Acidimicrobiaceae bacterium]